MEENFFAVPKINEEFKYEVSFFSNQLFFHCLSFSKVPKDSSLIWFEDVKQREWGPSYKGSLLKKGYNKSINSYDDLINVFRVEKGIENESEKMRLMEYKRCLENKQKVSFESYEMLLYLDSNSNFDIVRPYHTFDGQIL
ncbi:hypothetical protein Avbf_14198 [Armadillidium vulgare]|nr:hypothetical protein Avbf_14198 [Armadillidium vulgare]